MFKCSCSFSILYSMFSFPKFLSFAYFMEPSYAT